MEKRINTSARLAPPLAVGRSAEIYPWEQGRVLKLFFPEIPHREIRDEYRNTCEAHARGVCAMACHGLARVKDRQGIILDRVDGISLTRTPEKNPLNFFSLPRKLSELHRELHGTTTTALSDVREIALDMLNRPALNFLTPGERQKAKEVILALPGGDTVLHMDFHPENVLVAQDGCIPIDWMTAARGVPAADVASTVFLMRDAELFPGISLLKKYFYEIVRRYILSCYLRHYMRETGLTMAQVREWRLPVLMLRLGLWDIPSERQRLSREIRQLLTRTGGDQ